MRKFLLLFIFTLLFGTAINAQIRPIIGISKDDKPRQKEVVVEPRDNQKKRVVSTEPDTVYSNDYIRKFGWLEPVGYLTKDQVAHRSKSYRFTGKNKEGHWTRMEAVDARGRLVSGGPLPYIVNLSTHIDTTSNSNWLQRLNTSSIYEQIPDPTGKNKAVERVFDTDNKLLYTYTLVPIGPDRYFGTYRDQYGLPAEMRETPGMVYGTCIELYLDSLGNDWVLSFMDGAGYYKDNESGTRYKAFPYDEKGRFQIGTQFFDENDNMINNNLGYACVLYSWDEDTSLLEWMSFNDKDYNLVVPTVPKYEYLRGVPFIRYYHDEYCRLKYVSFFDEQYNPTTNYYGAHSVWFGYDSVGNVISITGFDLDDNFAPFDKNNVTGINRYYDEQDRLIEMEYLQANGYYVEYPNYAYIQYNYEGPETGVWYYVKYNDEPKLYYSDMNIALDDGSENETIYSDGSYEIQKYDSKDRGILYECHDADGNLTNTNYGFARRVIEYKDYPGKTELISRWFDKDGKLNFDEGFDTKIELMDSVSKTKDEIYYAGDEVVYRIKRILNDDMVHIKGYHGMNNFGMQSRAGGDGEHRFYNVLVSFSPLDHSSADVYLDEFGEPDYVVEDDLVYHYQRFTKDNIESRDEEDALVKDSQENNMYNFILPKVINIEVTDSVGYSLGLRDDDIILRYGNYVVDFNRLEDYKDDILGRWALFSVMESSRPREMIVFRIDAASGQYGLKSISLPPGPPSQLGFTTHLRYLTKKQVERIKEVAETSPEMDLSMPMEEDDGIYRKYDVVAHHTDVMRKNARFPREKEFKDPIILLAAYDGRRVKKWTGKMEMELNPLDEHTIDNKEESDNDTKFPKRIYFYTADGVSVESVTVDGPGETLFNLDYELTLQDCQALGPLNENLDRLVQEAVAQLAEIERTESDIKDEDIAGYWELEKSDDPYAPGGFIYFDKVGTCIAEFTGYGRNEIVSGEADTKLVKIKNSGPGKWNITDSNLLAFDFNNILLVSDSSPIENSDSLENISDIPYLKYDSDSLWPLSLYTRYREKANPSARIINLDKKTMTMEGSDGEQYRFLKKGKNPPKSDEIQNLMTKKLIIDSGKSSWLIKKSDPVVYVYFGLYYEENLTVIVSDILQVSDNPEDGLINYHVFTTLPIEISNARIKILKQPPYRHINPDYTICNISDNAEISVEEIDARIVEEVQKIVDSFVGLEIEPFAKKDKLKMGDKYYEKLPEMMESVYMTVCHETGTLPDNNIRGEFVVAKFGDWNYTQGNDAFVAEFDKRKNQPVEMTVIRIDTEEEDILEPLSFTLPAGRMGADFTLRRNETFQYFNNIFNTYKIAKVDGKH